MSIDMQARPDALTAAEVTEQALGCPFDPGSAMSFAASMAADETESEPHTAYQAAWDAGLHEHIVPVAEGGRLESFESLLGVLRAVSRRDLSVSVGFGSTFLATTPVWIWGDDIQRADVARLVLDRAWGTAGISEDAAGSDLRATATSAMPVPGGYLLTGRKWLVGNGARSSFAVVLAGSAPSFGMFLLRFAPDLPSMNQPGVERLPKVRTLGLRGHDLSGFELSNHPVGPDAVLGRPGRGIEMVSGMLQFTRTLVGGMSLGAADSGLRIALRHARGRMLYGEPALALPPVHGLIAQAFADVLVAEATQIGATRGLNVAPRRMALWSAVAKYAVPGLCIDALQACGEVLSARAYLREAVAGGVFQKIMRDAAITPVFEGTQLVQLETIRAQLASGQRGGTVSEAIDLDDLFAVGTPVPPWSPQTNRPSITYGGSDEIVDLLETALADLPVEIEELARPLIAVRDSVRAGLQVHGRDRSQAAYDAARRHALVHAAACCLHLWSRRDRLSPFASDPAWLSVALRRILTRLELPVERDLAAEQRLVGHLMALDDDDRAFSLIPTALATQFRETTP